MLARNKWGLSAKIVNFDKYKCKIKSYLYFHLVNEFKIREINSVGWCRNDWSIAKCN